MRFGIFGLEVYNRMQKLSSCASVDAWCNFVTDRCHRRSFHRRHDAKNVAIDCGVQVGLARSVLRSTRATALRVSTTALVSRRTASATARYRHSGVGAWKGSGERFASGETRASANRAWTAPPASTLRHRRQHPHCRTGCNRWHSASVCQCQG